VGSSSRLFVGNYRCIKYRGSAYVHNERLTDVATNWRKTCRPPFATVSVTFIRSRKKGGGSRIFHRASITEHRISLSPLEYRIDFVWLWKTHGGRAVMFLCRDRDQFDWIWYCRSFYVSHCQQGVPCRDTLVCQSNAIGWDSARAPCDWLIKEAIQVFCIVTRVNIGIVLLHFLSWEFRAGTVPGPCLDRAVNVSVSYVFHSHTKSTLRTCNEHPHYDILYVNIVFTIWPCQLHSV
jgi:hypothetical protein